MLGKGKSANNPLVADLKDLMPLNKSHIIPAAEVLARAFQNYPVFQYSFPDELERKKTVPYIFQNILSYGVRYGETYGTSRRLEGVAVWLTSDNYPATFWKSMRSGALPIMFKMRGEGAKRMKHFDEYIDVVHRRLAPFKHWFLQVIGVDPQFRGKGYAGKRLIRILCHPSV